MPTPESLRLPNINPIPRRKPVRGFQPGNKFGRGGLKIPKITRDIKNGVLTAAENLGRDGKGAGGFIGFMEYLGWHHPKAFCHLLGKLLPHQINADITGTSATTISILTVPVDRYLRPEIIEELHTPAPESAIDQGGPEVQSEPLSERDRIVEHAREMGYTPLPPRLASQR